MKKKSWPVKSIFCQPSTLYTKKKIELEHELIALKKSKELPQVPEIHVSPLKIVYKSPIRNFEFPKTSIQPTSNDLKMETMNLIEGIISMVDCKDQYLKEMYGMRILDAWNSSDNEFESHCIEIGYSCDKMINYLEEVLYPELNFHKNNMISLKSAYIDQENLFMMLVKRIDVAKNRINNFDDNAKEDDFTVHKLQDYISKLYTTFDDIVLKFDFMEENIYRRELEIKKNTKSSLQRQ